MILAPCNAGGQDAVSRPGDYFGRPTQCAQLKPSQNLTAFVGRPAAMLARVFRAL